MKSTAPTIALILALSVSTTSVYARQSQEDRRDYERYRPELAGNQERFNQRMSREREAVWAVLDNTSRVRSQFFRDDLRKFDSHVSQVYFLRHAPMSAEWAREHLERRSNELQESTEKLREFIDRGTNPPKLNLTPLPEETVYERLRRLDRLADRLVPNLLQLVEGDVLDLDLLSRVREDLAITEALSRALPESGF